jgi:histone arginine demethylase JMJD6
MNNSSFSNTNDDDKPTWERRLNEAKVKHRPKLKNWGKDGFAFDTGIKSDLLKLYLNELKSPTSKEHGFINIKNPTSGKISCDNLLQNRVIDRISCKKLSVNDFITSYEDPCTPVIISDIPEYENWKALHQNTWSFSNIKSKLKERLFKVGEDDDGYKVKVKMGYFLKYLNENKDDSPLYVFDSNYDNDPVSKILLEDYTPPSYFKEDLFELIGEKRRPPYRWFLLGPKRSGTCLHIDPLGTSAWNTVIQGRKRWVLFPPETTKSIAKGWDVIFKGEDDEAVNYFVDILPRIKAKHGKNIKIIEFTQLAGDTVFVPSGWWHAVMNLDDTVAITQNFCSRSNFDKVWRETRTGRKKMAIKWAELLETNYPDLTKRSAELNENDKFIYPISKKTLKLQEEEKKKTQLLITNKITKTDESEKKKKKKKKDYKEDEKGRERNNFYDKSKARANLENSKDDDDNIIKKKNDKKDKEELKKSKKEKQKSKSKDDKKKSKRKLEEIIEEGDNNDKKRKKNNFLI